MATPTRPCPYCGAAVLMNAPACGTCGRPMPPMQAGAPPGGAATGEDDVRLCGAADRPGAARPPSGQPRHRRAASARTTGVVRSKASSRRSSRASQPPQQRGFPPPQQPGLPPPQQPGYPPPQQQASASRRSSRGFPPPQQPGVSGQPQQPGYPPPQQRWLSAAAAAGWLRPAAGLSAAAAGLSASRRSSSRAIRRSSRGFGQPQQPVRAAAAAVRPAAAAAGFGNPGGSGFGQPQQAGFGAAAGLSAGAKSVRAAAARSAGSARRHGAQAPAVGAGHDLRLPGRAASRSRDAAQDPVPRRHRAHRVDLRSVSALQPELIFPFSSGVPKFDFLIWPLIAGGAYLLVAAAPPDIRAEGSAGRPALDCRSACVRRHLHARWSRQRWPGGFGAQTRCISSATRVLVFGLLARIAQPTRSDRAHHHRGRRRHAGPGFFDMFDYAFNFSACPALLDRSTTLLGSSCSPLGIALHPVRRAAAEAAAGAAVGRCVRPADLRGADRVAAGAGAADGPRRCSSTCTVGVGAILIMAHVLLRIVAFFGVLMMASPAAYEEAKAMFTKKPGGAAASVGWWLSSARWWLSSAGWWLSSARWWLPAAGGGGYPPQGGGGWQ